MKKMPKARKLVLCSEIIRTIKFLSLNELRAANVVGASDPNCDPTSDTANCHPH